MIPPFRRDRLRLRNRLDEVDARGEARERTPAERVERALALSQVVRELAHATGADRMTDEHGDLAEKGRLYAEPLRLLCHRGD